METSIEEAEELFEIMKEIHQAKPETKEKRKKYFESLRKQPKSFFEIIEELLSAFKEAERDDLIAEMNHLGFQQALSQYHSLTN